MGLFRKAGGGGFLNGVDAVITGYKLTDEFNGEPFNPKRKTNSGKPAFHFLNVALTTRVDGATEDQTTTLKAGTFSDFQVSEDGLTLTPNSDGAELWGNLDFAILIQSMVEAEPKLAELLTEYDFRAIIGARVRFRQQVNAEKTSKQGKVPNKKDPSKPGFDRKDLVVDAVYSLAAQGAAKPAGKTTSAKGKAVAAVDVNELAKSTLIDIVNGAGGKIQKAKLSMATVEQLTGHTQMNDVRILLNRNAFLSSVEGVNYDEETQTVSIVA
jgi:hypothetical protein